MESFPKTFDAFAPSFFTDFFASAKLTPNYIPLSTLETIPTNALHRISYEHAKKHIAPGTFAHSIRCFYYALAILFGSGFPSNTPNVPQIATEELINRLYHACILHDLGTSGSEETMSHPSHAMTFEFHGGIMAYEFLLAQSKADAHSTLSPEQVGDIVQSIMLHTFAFTNGKSSSVGVLLQLSAALDIFGFNVLGTGTFDSLISKRTVKEIEEVYPRGEFGEEGVRFQEELKKKPGCLLSHFPADFAKSFANVKTLVPEENYVPSARQLGGRQPTSHV